MKALAEALVRAVTYINCLPDPNEEHIEEDVRMLDETAHYLSSATDEEKEALASAAQGALEEEQSGAKRPDDLIDYGSWMEDMFGDGWEGNRRV